MGGAYDSKEEKRNVQCLAVHPEGKGQLVRLGEKVIFKCILKSDWGVWTAVRGVRIRQVACCGEYGDEPSCSADCGAFLGFASGNVLHAVSYQTRSCHWSLHESTLHPHMPFHQDAFLYQLPIYAQVNQMVFRFRQMHFCSVSCVLHVLV